MSDDSLRGERGPTGDVGGTGPIGHVGRPGLIGKTGRLGNTGIAGPRGGPGPAGPEGAHHPKLLETVLGRAAQLTIAAVVLIIVITSLIRTHDADRQLDAIAESRAAEQAAEDCQDLYVADVTRASGSYLAEFGDLFSAVVQLPPAVDDATRAANRELVVAAVAELDVKKSTYQAAIAALEEFLAVDPPPHVCPHP